MEEQGIRINKYLSAAGVCSRRKADQLIEEGKVLVDKKKAVPGTRVFPNQEVICEDKVVSGTPKPIILLVNKPVGVVCTTQKKEKDNIVDFLHYPQRVYPVGRLDKNSRGLILMTNQGEIMDQLLRSSNYHEKEYVVTVQKDITKEFLDKMSKGVFLSELGVKTRPCKVRKVSARTFRIVLTQGLNRQIRRMCQELGYGVQDLYRERIMNLTVEGIEEGNYREITKKEYQVLCQLLN